MHLKNILTTSINLLMVLGLSAVSNVYADSCVDYSPALKQMHVEEDVFITEEAANKEAGQKAVTNRLKLNYRVADDSRERAAGFQHICARTAQKEQILFVFNSPVTPSFHMRNVNAVLDIAFIDENGLVIDVQTMHPYYAMSLKKPTYAPPSPALYALEAHAGYFKENGIIVGKSRLEKLSKLKTKN